MIRDLSLVEWENPATPLPWDIPGTPFTPWLRPSHPVGVSVAARKPGWKRLFPAFGTVGVLLVAAWWLMQQVPRG